ncbi:MAG: ATP-binding protein [Alphaproteobacteria bacterium]|nr:ATP-binding protein [Rhodospirillales bacterium]MCW9045555.1 ATP-binding protein [Alphaproteobacteria bacterium]
MKSLRLYILFLFVSSTIFIVAVSWVVKSWSEDQIKEDVEKTLKAALDGAHHAINLTYKTQNDDVRAWAAMANIREAATALLATPRTPESLLNSPAQKELRELFRPLLSSVGYRGFFIISPDNINLASSRDANVGIKSLLAKQPDFLKRVRNGETTHSLPQKSDVPLLDYLGEMVDGLATFFIGTPIWGHDGQIIAILTLRIDPDNVFSNMLSQGQFGKSGESYAFNKEGFLISESRFLSFLKKLDLLGDGHHSDLIVQLKDPGEKLVVGKAPMIERDQQPLTYMAQQAIKGLDGISLEPYNDYRGVKVVGAWAWNDKLQFGIATETDAEEAFVQLNSNRKIIFGGTGLLLLFLYLLIFVFYRYQSKQQQLVENLKESELKIRSIIETANEGFWLVDNEAITKQVNPAMCAILGRTQDQIIGQSVYSFVDNRNKELFKKQINSRQLGEKGVYEIELSHPDGNKVPCLFNANPYYDAQGNKDGSFAMVTDITDRKNHERELAKISEQAQAANTAKSEFLSNMSHELRTPLNAILGFAQMMELAPEKDIQKKSLNHIMNGGKHLLDLIDQVLDLAKIEVGKLDVEIEEVDVASLIEDCSSTIMPMAKGKNITIIIEGLPSPVRIFADPLRVKQAMLNLLSNAVKYNRENGEVRIKPVVVNQEWLQINISDTGQGIPTELQAQLFHPFNRLGAEKSGVEGTGIGLALTKNLVEEMNGHIGVVSAQGEGATFWFEFPISNKTDQLIDSLENTKSAPVEFVVDSDEDVARLLYVEDNASNLALMEMIVSGIPGLVMVSAFSAEVALVITKNIKFDIIILDINLPGMSGIDLLTLLKAKKEMSTVPILALSADVMPETIRKGLDAGFVDYLAKPIEVPTLMAALNKALGKTP